MIKLIAIFFGIGVAYLYLLENLGNFITRGLDKFENLDTQRQQFERKDLSDLKVLVMESASDIELKMIHDRLH